jgi:hypothetical protein
MKRLKLIAKKKCYYLWNNQLSVYIFIFNKISLLFHPNFLNLTCAYPYLYNLMLTASYVCRLYYPQITYIVPHTLQKCMLDVYCDILANLD